METTKSVGQSVSGRLEGFIREIGNVADTDSDFNRQVHLFHAGYLDSLGVELLIAFIEGEFDIELGDEALNSSGFSSVDGISAIINEELHAKGGADGENPYVMPGGHDQG